MMLNMKVLIKIDRVYCDILFVIIMGKVLGVVVLFVDEYVESIEFMVNIVIISMFEEMIFKRVLREFWFILGILFCGNVLFVICVKNVVVIESK